MNNNHITIIGASSAGLFAAYLLARAGQRVRVYEAAETLEPNPRTLIVTGEISRVLGFVPEEAIINRIHRIELFSRNASARVTLAEPDLVIERERLIRLLMERARGAGAEVSLGHRFLNLERDGKGPVLRLENCLKGRIEEINAGIVIGADGAMSHVARLLPQPDHKNGRAIVSILQARVVLPPRARADTVQVWFERGHTRFFYWLIPESPIHAVVGLGAYSLQKAQQRLADSLSQRNLVALDYQVAAIPLHTCRAHYSARLAGLPATQNGGPNVFLVGDAASQVKATTIGGVVPGLRGARAVAKSIVCQRDYMEEIRELKRELNLHLFFRKILDRFINADYDELLSLLNHRTRSILESRNRDQMAGAFWDLFLAQPRGLLLGLKAALRRGAG